MSKVLILMTNEYNNIDSSLSSIASAIGGNCFEESIVVANINKFNNDITNNRLIGQGNSFSINYGSFLLAINGSLSFSIDYKDYTLSKNNWMAIFPNNIISLGKMSENFYGILIISSKSFFEDTISSNKTIPISFFGNINKVGNMIPLSEVDTLLLKEATDRITYYMKADHLFKREMVTLSFLTYLLELGNIALKESSVSKISYTTSRKEIITQQFIRLVRMHAKHQHSIAFYSGKLCISTKHLSLVVRETTGRTAKDWIAGQIILEAKILFRKPGTTIQAISDELNFSDQASFSKFFKNHTGFTPKKYILAL